ncbi:Uncharacterised protein [Chlamydia trachomatis]|nr:Uncharacterised protein [Chlamydia trachomatis]
MVETSLTNNKYSVSKKDKVKLKNIVTIRSYTKYNFPATLHKQNIMEIPSV